MKSAASCSKALFKSAVKRSWPVWMAYLALWLVCLPGYIGSRLLDGWDVVYSGEPARLTVYYVLESAATYGVIFSFCAAILAAMCVFSFMYNSRSASAMGALPIKRGGMFTAQMLAGICPLFAANLIVAAVTFCVETACGVAQLMPLVRWFVLTGMQLVLFYGLACLCAQLTGHTIVLPCVYVVLSFTVIVLELVVGRAASIFVYGIEVLSTPLAVLSPVYYMLTSMGVNVPSEAAADDSWVRLYAQTQFEGWTGMVIYLAAGIVLIALAMLLFRRRRLEVSGDVVAVEVLKPVFKYCFALGGALVIGVVIHSIFDSGAYTDGSVWLLLALMLISGFVFYFAAEMLIKKTFHVWKAKAWAGFAVFAVVFGGVVCAAEFDLFSYETKRPYADSVESVMVYGDFDPVVLYEPENIEAVLGLHGDIIDNKQLNEQSIRSGSYIGSDTYVTYVCFSYELKNGGTLARQYYIAEPLADVETLETVLNLQEAIDWRKATEIPITENTINFAEVYWVDASSAEDVEYKGGESLSLTGEEAYELYTQCILPDIRDGALGRIWIITDEDYYNTVYDCSISIELGTMVDGRWQYDHLRTTPTVDSVRTNEWLRQHGVEPLLIGHYNTQVADRPAAATVEVIG